MGLMPTQGNVPPAAPADGKDPARYTDAADSNMASPEEQAAVEEALENAAALMFDVQSNDFRPEIAQSLSVKDAPPLEDGAQSQPPHIMALANTTVTIVSKLDDSAREANAPMNDDVLQEVGQNVLEMLVQQAEAQGIQEYSQDDMDGAFITATDMYRAKAIADGRTDEDTLKGQWGEIIAADQEGRIDEVLPGASKAGAPEQPMEA